MRQQEPGQQDGRHRVDLQDAIDDRFCLCFKQVEIEDACQIDERVDAARSMACIHNRLTAFRHRDIGNHHDMVATQLFLQGRQQPGVHAVKHQLRAFDGQHATNFAADATGSTSDKYRFTR